MFESVFRRSDRSRPPASEPWNLAEPIITNLRTWNLPLHLRGGCAAAEPEPEPEPAGSAVAEPGTWNPGGG